MFGRLHSCKRPLETLRAISIAEEPNLHVIVVGPHYDVSKEECERAIGNAGKRMHWVGQVYGDSKWRYISAADGYITLSEKENYNYCLAECLSAGLPVIVSPGNDLSGELLPVKCGWMLSDNLEASAVGAIKEFCSASGNVLRAMSENGRGYANRELSRDVFNQRLTTLVENYTG